MHDAIANQFAVGEDVPCADPGLLGPLKRTAIFRSLRPRLAGGAPHPVFDSWLDDGFSFFAFQLLPEPDVEAAGAGLAVFAMHPEMENPVSAIEVTPTVSGMHARITDLKGEVAAYIAPFKPEEPSPENRPDG